MTIHKPILALILAASLTACGGGGGSGGGAELPEVDTRTVAPADPGSALPAHWQNGTFMQVFVRAYQDSDGDGTGDLKGLTAKLDYLKELGITGLWLMPVTASQDHDHGYAVTDYRAIERAYGSLADLDELLRQAHARGIGVILDYVMNHSAAQNALFVNSSAGADNTFRDWYVWSASHPGGWSIFGSDPWHAAGSGWYFGAFWDQMPDFNLLNPTVLGYHHDNLRFWLNRGADGFRFDAVGNLVENGPSAWEIQPQNYSIMGGVRNLLATYAQRFMVCEAPADPAGFGAANACGSAFAFGHQHDILAAAKGSSSAVRSVANYFASGQGSNQGTLLSNHDSFAGDRVYDQVGGNLAQYRLAAATYLLQPGIPFIYYGEEVGMSGGAGLTGDPRLRTPMSWTANAAGFTSGAPFRSLSANIGSFNVEAQAADPDSLLAFYKSLLALRTGSPALARGSYEVPVADGSVLSFQRHQDAQHALVVINYGGTGASVSLGGLKPNLALAPAFAWPAVGATLNTGAAGTTRLAVPAQSVTVFTFAD